MSYHHTPLLKLKKQTSYPFQSSGSKKIILKNGTIPRTIFTMDSGRIYFMVKINQKNIKVFAYDNKKSENGLKKFNNHTEGIYEYNYRKLVCTITEYKGFWDGYDAEINMHGSSVLIKLAIDEYVYIGSTIYIFKTDSYIRYFTASVSNGLNTYPLAYSKNYIYLLKHRKRFKKDGYVQILTNCETFDFNSNAADDLMVYRESIPLAKESITLKEIKKK